MEETQLAICAAGTPEIAGGTPEFVPETQVEKQYHEELEREHRQELEDLQTVLEAGHHSTLESQQHELEALYEMENQRLTVQNLKTKFNDDERTLLKSVIKDYGMQQVRDGLKTWDSKELWWSIVKTYNNEVQVRAQPNLTPLAILHIFEMCRSINWCVCGNRSRVRTNSN